jgi:hypothetical protein
MIADIIMLTLEPSSLILYYGISKSIKEALKTEVHTHVSLDEHTSLFQRSLSLRFTNAEMRFTNAEMRFTIVNQQLKE